MKFGSSLFITVFTAFSISFGTGTFAFAVDNKSQNSGDYIQKVGNAQINWSDNVIKVTGTGAPPDKGNPAQRRLMALRAAKVDAYRQLLEVTEGVHVSSETIVKDFVTESDVIKTQVSGLVKGAQQAGEPRYMSDGSVEVDIQINIFGGAPTPENKTDVKASAPSGDSLASIMIPQEIEKRKTDDIPSTKIAPVTVNENYSSVIIDCKGLGIQPAMSPAIFDSDNGEIYFGDLPMDADFVINEGIVSYTTSIVEAKKNERSGSNPLVIKAKKVHGNFKADVIISNDDAKKLIGANEKSKFLNDAKVIFLI